MDSSAISAIEELTNAKQAQEKIDHELISAVVIPNSHKLESLERLKPEPNHFRGQFRTTVISEFINYINNNGDDTCSVFIDKSSMTAKAIAKLTGRGPKVEI